ncbi:MAG: acetylxylan esterase [Bacteroidetes bacterium]|nr:acetylxylan esterase [Bacteroidota bacterium]
MKYLLILYVCSAVLSPHIAVSKNFGDEIFDWHHEKKIIFIADTLPKVFPKNHADLIADKLTLDAAVGFGINQLPGDMKDWEKRRTQLKTEIIKKTGVVINHNLDLNIKETGTIQMKGYAIKKITFQTRPGIYATANLYIPEGKGPFPAVIFMIGHWPKGKIDPEGPQAVGHSLALNGYVCLSIDPWGSGERTTIHGIFEDHGDENNLGSSLLNIGETLMGIEISDNMRGVDLLCSLPYVDSKNIGATGASGGGNQTMWLTAMDERIKAAMPVVSVGTFQSYIMGTPCICEVVPDAFDMTEEAGILALIAPRAIKMCNHKKDDNPAFFPSEMIRSYTNAKPIFKLYGVEDNIAYQLFDLRHGYMAEDREAVLGWFDLHLKGNGNGYPKKEIQFDLLPEKQLMVFPKGQRDANVSGTVEYCKRRGNELRSAFLNASSTDTAIKRKELRNLLGVSDTSILNHVYEYQQINEWNRFALATSDNKLIPVLVRTPKNNSNEFVIVCNPEGKDSISANFIDELIKSGKGIAIVDLSGTGEASSTAIGNNYRFGRLRTIARSELWFGRTMIGEWVKELTTVSQFLNSKYKAAKLSIDGSKEAGLAGLFFSVLGGNIDHVTLRKSPVSYLFDTREGIDFFSAAIHLPGFLEWGDVSLAAALSGKNILFNDPVTISGQKITGIKLEEYQREFANVRLHYMQPGNTVFK